jgi:ABC-type multidrug transport system fused ATPase/permease subunit
MIFVMKEGGLVEAGTHEALLTSKGLYYDMWNSQRKPKKKRQLH